MYCDGGYLEWTEHSEPYCYCYNTGEEAVLDHNGMGWTCIMACNNETEFFSTLSFSCVDYTCGNDSSLTFDWYSETCTNYTEEMWCGDNAYYNYANSSCTCFDYYATYDIYYNDCFCDGMTQYDAVLGITYCSYCDFGHDEYGNCLNDTNNHTDSCDPGYYFDEWNTSSC
jgi:hypothetical protein